MLLLLGACAERALPVPASSSDLSTRDTASPAGGDLGVCGNTHSYQPVPLSFLDALDHSMRFTFTAAVRVAVGFELRAGCDIPADITTTVMPGNATTSIGLSAHAFIGTDGCGPSMMVTRVVTLPAATVQNQILHIYDATAGTSAMPIQLTVVPGTMPACASVGLGDTCLSDCDCTGADPIALCLVSTAGLRRCARPCNEDAACRFSNVPTCETSAFFACIPQERCHVQAECPFGNTIEACACRPAFPVGASPSSCGCDAECGTGTLCSSGQCVQPCSGQYTCGVFGGGEGGQECIDGVCLQLI